MKKQVYITNDAKIRELCRKTASITGLDVSLAITCTNWYFERRFFQMVKYKKKRTKLVLFFYQCFSQCVITQLQKFQSRTLSFTC